jgi:predicted hydrolase (HD superfamily)
MPTRDDAWKLLCEYTQSESLRKHMLAVEACVRAYARKNGADENLWGLAALLHDFDYERWPNHDHAADRSSTRCSPVTNLRDFLPHAPTFARLRASSTSR